MTAPRRKPGSVRLRVSFEYVPTEWPENWTIAKEREWWRDLYNVAGKVRGLRVERVPKKRRGSR